MNPADRRSPGGLLRACAALLVALAALAAPAVDAPPSTLAVPGPVPRDSGPRPGAQPLANLRFALPARPTPEPAAPGDQRLQKLRQLSQATNSLAELARELESLLTSDAEASVKKEARRLALLELAYQEELAASGGSREGHLERSLQLLGEFVELHPSDPLVPEVLLRQGLLCRRLGLPDRAIDRFYMAMRAANRMEARSLEQFRRLVLMAQSEIADTEAEAGRHAEAAELYQRLLRGRSDDLDVEVLLLKCTRSLASAGDLPGLEAQAGRLLGEFPESEHAAEARCLLARGLSKAGREEEARRQRQLLLEAVEAAAPDRRARWAAWKFRVGNDLANELYLRRDYANALLLYRSLLPATTNSAWRHPVLYQIGLCEEQMGRRPEARAAYSEIVEDPVATHAPPDKLLLDMARLRIRILQGVEASLRLGAEEVLP